MYIELFLLDDLLMNLLIVRLAAALLSVRPPLYRQTAVAAASAAYAALAAYLLPALASVWLRPLPMALIVQAIPYKNAKGFFTACAAVLISTFAVGGAALCIAVLSGGGIKNGFISGGIPLRTAALAALAAAAMPRAVRSVLMRRAPKGMLVRLTVEHGGIKRSFTALVDTGNRLAEPVTGLPVAVVNCAAFKRCALLPIRVDTAGGPAVLMAFKPDRICVDGVPVCAVAAVANTKMRFDALIPPVLCVSPDIAKGSGNTNSNVNVNENEAKKHKNTIGDPYCSAREAKGAQNALKTDTVVIGSKNA